MRKPHAEKAEEDTCIDVASDIDVVVDGVVATAAFFIIVTNHESRMGCECVFVSESPQKIQTMTSPGG